MDSEKKTIPEFKSYKEIADFCDTQSLADYWDQTDPAEFEISPEVHRRFLVPLDRHLLTRVHSAAHHRGVSTESLINLLVEQELKEVESD